LHGVLSEEARIKAANEDKKEIVVKKLPNMSSAGRYVFFIEKVTRRSFPERAKDPWLSVPASRQVWLYHSDINKRIIYVFCQEKVKRVM